MAALEMIFEKMPSDPHILSIYPLDRTPTVCSLNQVWVFCKGGIYRGSTEKAKDSGGTRGL